MNQYRPNTSSSYSVYFLNIILY